MGLSLHEQDILKTFAESHFGDLSNKCISFFNEEPRLPGFGKVVSDDDLLTMKVSLSVSLSKSYEVLETHQVDMCVELADLFAQEYVMHLCELFVEALTYEEDIINTSVSKLLKYCKMEHAPVLITSPEVGGVFAKEKGFIGSDVTAFEIDDVYFYELGKIGNLTIVIDPLQNNSEYAYLLTGNIIEYSMRPNKDEESFVKYELSEDGNDLVAIYKPVVLYYQVDMTGLNYKFFSIQTED